MDMEVAALYLCALKKMKIKHKIASYQSIGNAFYVYVTNPKEGPYLLAPVGMSEIEASLYGVI